MFERRVFGLLGFLLITVAIWQISPGDVAEYRESPVPYLTGAVVVPSSQTEAQRRANHRGDNVLFESGGVRRAFGYAGEDGAGTGRGSAAGHGRRSREGAGEWSDQGVTSSGSSSSTQSLASLTVANTVGELLPNDDYHSLIDLGDFRFTINYDYCGAGTDDGGRTSRSSSSSSSRNRAAADEDFSRKRRSRSRLSSLKRGDALRGTRTTPSTPPLVLVLIHSAPANLAKRNTIRTTWGRTDPRAKLIFLMGAVGSSALQRDIEQESLTHDDIVQGNFVDAYRNMTYKHVMALKWFTYHCPGARYLLKTDDDVFINTPVLYDVLERVAPQQNLLLCQLVTKLAVKRTHRSKWFVSWREYPAPYYPPHCPGYSILYSHDVARQLYHEAQRQPFFWIDDVHITGTVAQNVNVTITPMDDLYLDHDKKRTLLQDKPDRAAWIVFFFTNPNLPMHEIRELWEAVTLGRNHVRR